MHGMMHGTDGALNFFLLPLKQPYWLHFSIHGTNITILESLLMQWNNLFKMVSKQKFNVVPSPHTIR